MTDREKLIELLGADTCGYECEACERHGNEDACIRHLKESMADYLLARGVVVLPCGPGAELTRGGKTFKADHWNVTLSAFREEPSNRSGRQVALFSAKEAEEALRKMDGGADHEAL